MKTIQFLFTIFISHSVYTQGMSFLEYENYQANFERIENQMDSGNYSFAIQELSKIEQIPFDEEYLYFLTLADCYYELGNLKDARRNYSLFSKNWGFRIALETRNKRIVAKDSSNLFFETILNDYDSILRVQCNPDYLKLKNTIIDLNNKDQEIRHEIMNAKRLKDSVTFNRLIARLDTVDSLNYRVYDSIASIHNWIHRKFHVNYMNGCEIVLMHQDKETYYKNISRAYNAAELNQVNWSELMFFQAYALFRSCTYNLEKVDFLSFYNLNELDTNESKFLFFTKSLFLCLRDSDFSKVQLYCYQSSSEKNSAFMILEKVRNKLIEFGISPDSVILDENNYIEKSNDKLDNNSAIGIVMS